MPRHFVLNPKAKELGGASPCYFNSICGALAEITKEGKAICRKCKAKLRGAEYPLPVAGFNIYGREKPSFWGGQPDAR